MWCGGDKAVISLKVGSRDGDARRRRRHRSDGQAGLWRDNLDDWAATIRMTLRYRGAVMIAGLGLVGGPGQQQLAPDAGQLVGLADPAEEVHVGGRLPRSEPGARTGARRAALLAVDAVVEAELLLEVEGRVLALLVLVADDVVGARDQRSSGASEHAARSTT